MVIFNKLFILVIIAMNPEPILGIMGVWSMTEHHSYTFTHFFTPRSKVRVECFFDNELPKHISQA